MPQKQENLLLSQLNTIAEGLSETFAPFCEVVVHDLKKPEHAILSIHNNLSGRMAGDSVTELGLARLASPDFPEIVANYANTFSDGRPVKSTSIGIKNEQGEYIAALCLNVDMSLFRGMQNALARFTNTASGTVTEHLEPGGTEVIRKYIEQFAARLATTPHALKANEKKQLILDLKKKGLLDMKKAMDTVAHHLGISRATAYLYAREKPNETQG